MRANITESAIDVFFQYNPTIVERIKKVPGHRWDKQSRCWHVPIIQAENLIGEFKEVLPSSDIEKLHHVNDIIVSPPPPTLKSEEELKAQNLTILPFQWYGYNFLLSRRKCFLADETGLGKSVQSILAAEQLFYLNKIHKAIIFAPRPIISQWKDEILKFINIDDSNIILLDGSKSERQELYSRINDSSIKYVIMNYEKARLEDFALDFDVGRLLILDEVTKIKNYKSKVFQSFSMIPANYKFLLSGRPLQNYPGEIYTLNTLLENHLLGSFREFRGQYAVLETFRKYNQDDPSSPTIITKISDWRNLDKLGAILKKVVLRRTAKEVLPELPPITKEVYNVYPTQIEKEVYDSIFNHIDIKLQNASSENHYYIYNVLPLVVLEREFLDSPRLLMLFPSKHAAEIISEFGEFDYDGSKLDEIGNVVDMARDGQIIIFTQYERMARLLKQKLDTLGETSEVYGGDAPISIRSDFLAEKFRIIVSTDKGAYGVNEFRNAKTIINYDLPDNPAVLDQRLGRISGLRQSGNILVVNMLVPDQDMREAKIQEILNRKNVYFSEVFQ